MRGSKRSSSTFAADSHTITPTTGANVTLTQDAAGNLLATIQHAFDADTGLSALDGSDGFSASGVTSGDQLGYAVARAGDVNADGRDDVIVGAPGRSAAYVVFGSDQEFPSNLDRETGWALYGFD